MLFLISVLLQTAVMFAIGYFVHQIFWTIANVVRLFLFYKCRCDTFTYQEKIDLEIIEKNKSEVIVLDPETQTSEEFWENLNLKCDLEFEESKCRPNELLFHGKIKRRRKW